MKTFLLSLALFSSLAAFADDVDVDGWVNSSDDMQDRFERTRADFDRCDRPSRIQIRAAGKQLCLEKLGALRTNRGLDCELASVTAGACVSQCATAAGRRARVTSYFDAPNCRPGRTQLTRTVINWRR